MRTAIITDTNSGITVEEGKELGIHVMKMPVIINEETYYEGVNLTQEEFYRRLEGGDDVSTSQPSPGDTLALWDKLLADGYDGLVYIPMSRYMPFGIRRFNITSRRDAPYNSQSSLQALPWLIPLWKSYINR